MINNKYVRIAPFMLAPSYCFAKKDYESDTPYVFRYIFSIIVNAPSIILVMVVLYLIYSIAAKINTKKYVRNTLIGILISSAFPLIDTLNDEGWNPAIFGAFAATAVISIIAYINSEGLKEWIRTFIPIVLFFPLLPTFVFLNTKWQTILVDFGLNISW